MNYIQRAVEKDIKSSMFKGKAIIVFGARQVGKTTMIENILKKELKKNEVLCLNGDDTDIRQLFREYNEVKLRNLISGRKILFIDEAQRIPDVGLIIKIFVDRIKEIQVIVSGSSALELSSGIQEPLTGRKYEFYLYPFSFDELSNKKGILHEKRYLETRLIYGSYPEIVNDFDNAEKHIKLLAGSYLYKDLFILEEIKKPICFENLLKALALQIGSEVNYSELARMIGINKNTVERYIDLLEKAFIIFSLKALSRNVRNEIKKGQKIYFYDCGIRNAIIGNFSVLDSRSDKGVLWENYIISERIKFRRENIKSYFWRTVQQQEIDYIEVEDDIFNAYEIKWNPNKKYKLSKTFSGKYINNNFDVINKNNYDDFLNSQSLFQE